MQPRRPRPHPDDRRLLLQVACCIGMALAPLGCARGTVSSGARIGAPTVDGLPAVTGLLALPVHGTRPADTSVTATFADGRQQLLRIAGDTGSTVWSGTLTLQAGVNAFVLVAEDAASNVQQSPAYSITAVPTPPQTPTVDNSYADTVYIYTAAGSTPTLAGSKDPNGDLSIDGVQVAGLDGQARWQYVLPPLNAATPVQLRLTSTNAVAHTSDVVTVNVLSTAVPPVQLAAYAQLTNQSPIALKGTSTAGATVHLVWQGRQQDGLLQAVDANHVVFNANLAATGVVDGTLQAVFYQSVGNAQGPFTVAAIAYDVVPPQAPQILTPSGFGQTASPYVLPSAAWPASMQIVGSMPDPSARLCVGVGGGDACAITAPPASTFATNVSLQLGHNVIVVQGVDPAGNVSVATTQDVYVPTAPAFVIDSPKGDALVQGDSVTVAGHIYLAPADTQLASVAQDVAIVSVDVCIDALSCHSAEVAGSSFSATVPLAGLGAGTHTFAAGGTNSLGVAYTSAAGTPGVAAVHVASDAPTWLNGNEGAVLAARAASIAIDAAGTAHIVWEDFCPNAGASCSVTPTGNVGPDIFYTTRSAAGVWASHIRTVSMLGGQGGHSRAPSIAIDAAGLVHIAWADDGMATTCLHNTYGIFHRTLDPSTGAWSCVDLVAGQDCHTAKQPSLASNAYGSGPSVHLTWQRDSAPSATPQRKDVYYAMWSGNVPLEANTTFGTWTTPLQITQDGNTGSAQRPKVAMGPDQHVAIAWSECRGTACSTPASRHDVYLMDVSDPSTLDPLGAVIVTNSDNDTDGLVPALFVAQDNTRYVAWQGLAQTGGANGNTPSIFLRQYRGRIPDNRAPSAVWISAGQTTAAQAPAMSLAADGSYQLVWSQSAAGTGRASRVAQRSGHIIRGLAPSIALLPDTGSVALNASVAIDPSQTGLAHVTWDNTLSLASTASSNSGTTAVPSAVGSFYFLAAGPG